MKEQDKKEIVVSEKNEEIHEQDVSNELSDKHKNTSSTNRPNEEDVKNIWWLKYLITFGVLAVFTVLVGWVQGGFVEKNVNLLLAHWGDAFGIPGALAICFGLLIVATNGGTFDMLAYGMRRFFGLFRKNPIDRKYDNFYEYRKSRREKNRSFWYLIIVGGVYLLIGVTLMVIYSQI